MLFWFGKVKVVDVAPYKMTIASKYFRTVGLESLSNSLDLMIAMDHCAVHCKLLLILVFRSTLSTPFFLSHPPLPFPSPSLLSHSLLPLPVFLPRLFPPRVPVITLGAGIQNTCSIFDFLCEVLPTSPACIILYVARFTLSTASVYEILGFSSIS